MLAVTLRTDALLLTACRAGRCHLQDTHTHQIHALDSCRGCGECKPHQVAVRVIDGIHVITGRPLRGATLIWAQLHLCSGARPTAVAVRAAACVSAECAWVLKASRNPHASHNFCLVQHTALSRPALPRTHLPQQDSLSAGDGVIGMPCGQPAEQQERDNGAKVFPHP